MVDQIKLVKKLIEKKCKIYGLSNCINSIKQVNIFNNKKAKIFFLKYIYKNLKTKKKFPKINDFPILICSNKKYNGFKTLKQLEKCLKNINNKVIEPKINNNKKFNDCKKEKIGIVISCFNRPEYLSKTLKSVKESNMNDTILCIIDDHSPNPKIWNLINKFNISNSNCKIIKIRNKKNLGIRYVLKKGWNLLYPMCNYLCNIDNDVIVKKNWLNKLKETENKSRKKLLSQNVIVSGFNCTSSCSHKIIKDYNIFFTKKTIGGINMFFNKSTYNNIVYPILYKGNKNFNWDWEICYISDEKKCPIVVTKPSVIQHIGIKGLNSSRGKKIRYDIAEDF